MVRGRESFRPKSVEGISPASVSGSPAHLKAVFLPFEIRQQREKRPYDRRIDRPLASPGSASRSLHPRGYACSSSA